MNFADFSSANAFTDQVLNYEYETQCRTNRLLMQGRVHGWPQDTKNPIVNQTKENFMKYRKIPSPLHHGFSTYGQYVYRYHLAKLRGLENNRSNLYWKYLLTCGCHQKTAKKLEQVRSAIETLRKIMTPLKAAADRCLEMHKTYQGRSMIFNAVTKKYATSIKTDRELAQEIIKIQILKDEIPALVSTNFELGCEKITQFANIVRDIVQRRVPVTPQEVMQANLPVVFSGGPYKNQEKSTHDEDLALDRRHGKNV